MSLGQLVNMLRHLGHRLLVLGVPGDTAQVPELELDGGDLGGGAVWRPLGSVSHAILEVDIREGDS